MRAACSPETDGEPSLQSLLGQKLLSALPSSRAAGVHAVDTEERRGEESGGEGRGTRGEQRGGNQRRGEINLRVSKRALRTQAKSTYQCVGILVL